MAPAYDSAPAPEQMRYQSWYHATHGKVQGLLPSKREPAPEAGFWEIGGPDLNLRQLGSQLADLLWPMPRRHQRLAVSFTRSPTVALLTRTISFGSILTE